MTETLEKTAQFGAFPLEKGIGFRLWAPHAETVHLTGDFNDWSEDQDEMQSEENGNWYLEIPKAKNGDKYQFLIETQSGDTLRRSDPRARAMENSSMASIVHVDNYDWEDDDFIIDDWNNLVIYEMHIGTFNVTEEGKPGTFKSAIEKLPHLQKAGINAVELLPINEFAGDYSWGYNPAYPFAVEEAYGSPDDFKDFVKAAHAHGIAVILDVVYNHFGPSDISMWQFDGWSENGGGGIYFYNDWKANTPWGDTRPDYGRAEVRDYIVENALLWLDEYRCDGLRFDAVSYIRNVKGTSQEGDNLRDGYELMQRINAAVRERFPKKIMIAEDTDGAGFVTDKTEHGGMGFGAMWDLKFVHNVREVLLNREDKHRNLGNISAALSGEFSGDAFKRVIYTESHDEVANGKARITEEVAADDVDNFYSKKLSTLGAVLTLTTAGIPMIFQGQELLEDKWFCDQDPLDWSRKKEFSGIYNLYSDLIHMRRNQNGKTKGLEGRNTEIVHFDDANKVIAYLRWYDDKNTDGVLVVLNFSHENFTDYDLCSSVAGDWHLAFNSNWKGYDEKDFGDFEVSSFHCDDKNKAGTLSLSAYTGLIFTRS